MMSEKDEIELDDVITKKNMLLIVQYLEMHNFNPEKAKLPIISSELKDHLCEKDYLFVKDYDIYEGDELKNLIQSAYYLQI